MNPKKPRDKRELCYPFIFETSLKCDFEIATDELCCQVGAVLSHLAPDADTEPMLADLAALQRLIYNLNGSVRGKLGIFDADLEWLKARYDYYNEASRGSVTGFVLPQGPQPIPTLHLCRCGSKKVVRLLVRLEESEVTFDPILYRFANLLANFFFVLTVYLKQRWQVPEVPYVSINY
ncbi:MULTISPECIES: ATP--cob(I)alamin adenosyltransferase [Aeromonas]|uniref:ATP--cob(I)alamin adenosyltransferase n=1 Tax=Aeromonas TaxID=642 RepID=UPI000DD0A737|nr:MULTISPECIES: ATP--cob(I)alamin adenosyltransferase [Aeromonas]MCE9952800.1 ATP--cob(I)alamin adenosyltransferase [Aeromonas allosaccharophila]QSR49430.1 ATP--cob(I)alamin adenosyltransferase [Aeromonas veronii]